MVLEAIGHGKQSFFLDPDFGNSAIFQNYEDYKSLRISNYNDFKNTILQSIKNYEVNKIKDTDKYCLQSDKVTQRIYDYFVKN